MPIDLELIIVTTIPTLAGLFGVFWGAHTYRESQVLKRKEIVFPLIDDYDKSEKMVIAKKILDDIKDIKKYFDPEKVKVLDHEEEYYVKRNLDKILKSPRGSNDAKDSENLFSFDDGENEIRDSFDALLAFFGKLEYLRKIQLIREEDLSYFRYYIDKAAYDKNVVTYVKGYNFQLGDGLVDKAFKRTRAGPESTEQSKTQ